MPWTVDAPPSVAKNWTKSEKKKCVSAANAVIEDGGTDEDAIFACISNAGKSKKKNASAGGGMDIKNLDKYLIVNTGKASPEDVEDLRELEAELEAGVYALWSDELQTIVAFAFEPTRFDEVQAREWVTEAKKNKEKPRASFFTQVGAIVGAAMSAFVSRQQVAGLARITASRSFYDVQRLVDKAVCDQYKTGDAWPWIIDIGPNAIIVEIDGQKYSMAYSISEEDVVTLGDREQVDQEWVHEDGAPVMLHAFSVDLSGESEPEADGLIWKELIHPGSWYKYDGSEVEITAEMIGAVFTAWEDGLPKFISVPADDHHDWTQGQVPVESNRGFVKELKLVDEALYGGFDLTDPAIDFGVLVGNVADVSVALNPNVTHPESGEVYPWVLQHVLLTNDPLVQDLAPFGDVPIGASRGDAYMLVRYNLKEGNMKGRKQDPVTPVAPEPIDLSTEEKDLITMSRELNVDAGEIRAMVGERANVLARARSLEITSLVRALEGVGDHENVTQIEGHRHFPVVCAAVESALTDESQALALTAGGDGRTPLDAIVMAVVNAIPEEGRMPTASLQDPPRGDPDPERDDPTLQKTEEPSDEQIDELSTRLR